RAVLVSEAVSRAEVRVRVQAAETGLRMKIAGCAGGANVLADPGRLQQILLNLLTNAIKFTPSGGEVEVGCAHEHERIRIHVRDTGIGIPPEQLQRIFSPFVPLEVAPTGLTTPARGVGLGLAISRDLARAMNGDVTAESTVGRGSTLIVDLP